MRRDISELIDAQPDSASAITIIQLLHIVSRLAIAVAVGLLATAASTASAGGDVASSLIPAAVAAVVTGLCDRANKALRAISQTPAAGAVLKTDHYELVSMLQDLAAFIYPRANVATGEIEHVDVDLIACTAAVAEITAQHGRIMTAKVAWPSSDNYLIRLSTVQELLIKVGDASGASDSKRADLAKQFQSMAGKLNEWRIPDGLREYSNVSRPAPIPSVAGLDGPSVAAMPATALDPDASGAPSQVHSLDTLTGEPTTLPDPANPPPSSDMTTAEVDGEATEAHKQGIPTRAISDNDDTNPITWMADQEPPNDSAAQVQSPGNTRATEPWMEFRKALANLSNPDVSAGTPEAREVPRIIDGPSALG